MIPVAPDDDEFSLLDHPVLTSGRLQARWRNRPRFVILESGFTDGRNFLASWQAWRDDPAGSRQLHYLALQRAPCSSAVLAGAIGMESRLLDELRAAWPLPLPGFHRLILDQGRVVLTLIIGAIKQTAPQVGATVDAFFLHGPGDDLSARIFGRFARIAAPDALLAGGNASGELRRALDQVGFVEDECSVHRMVDARFIPKWPQAARDPVPIAQHAIVIGAGLAGAAACERLAARGWRVTLLERHQQAAQQASGNLAGIFMPQMSKDDNPSSRLARAAYLFALRHWQQIGGIGVAFSGEACGVLQLARDASHARVQREIAERWNPPTEFALWLEAEAAGSRSGGAGAHGAWLFPQGGWASPAGVCRAMLAACGDKLQTRFQHAANRLQRCADLWQVLDAEGALIAEAPVVILANGVEAGHFMQAGDLPMLAVRGQVTHLAADCVPDLPHVLCGDGYLTRPSQGICCLGASYDTDGDTQLRRSSQDANLARLAALLPGATFGGAQLPLTGRVGFRCVTSDRLPLAGALPDIAAAAGMRCERLKDVPRWPGLFGLLAYASRGLIWAPLMAELVAAQIAGEPLPLESDLAAALDPARFHFKTARSRT